MPSKDPEVRRETKRVWRDRNRDEVNAYQLDYYYAHREEINKRRRAARKERYRNDAEYREKEIARTRRRWVEKRLLKEWGLE